jgi:hypothetical protein
MKEKEKENIYKRKRKNLNHPNSPQQAYQKPIFEVDNNIPPSHEGILPLFQHQTPFDT